MNLSVQEIYALAGMSTADADGSFALVMERATESLASQTELPTFESWAKSYTADPSSYDQDMIGFWREQL